MRFGHSSHLVFIPTFCAESAYDTQVELACCISQLSAIPGEALARVCYQFCTHPSRSAAATPPVFPWSFQLRLVLCAVVLPSAVRDIHTASGTLCSCCVAFVCVTEVNKTWRTEKLSVYLEAVFLDSTTG